MMVAVIAMMVMVMVMVVMTMGGFLQARIAEHMNETRDAESQSLAAACGGNADDIATSQKRGPDAALNRCGPRESLQALFDVFWKLNVCELLHHLHLSKRLAANIFNGCSFQLWQFAHSVQQFWEGENDIFIGW